MLDIKKISNSPQLIVLNPAFNLGMPLTPEEVNINKTWSSAETFFSVTVFGLVKMLHT